MSNSLLALVTIFSFIVAPCGWASIPQVKVRIGRSLKQVLVKGNKVSHALYQKSDRDKYSQPSKSVYFNCRNKYANKLSGVRRPLLLAKVKTHGSPLKWNSARYGGVFRLVSSQKFDSCDLVNEIDLETYLSSLLAREMNSKWPIEVLKAQAVAARSYALHKIKTKEVSKKLGYEAHYDLDSSELHQVSGSLDDHTDKTDRVAQETRGEVLVTESGKLVPIFYHSKCGGKTITPDKVWGDKVEGYVSVNCPFCNSRGGRDWNGNISKTELKELLFSSSLINLPGTKIAMIKDSMEKVSLRFYLKDHMKVVSKADLRKGLGRKRVRSNRFVLEIKDSILKIRGKGHGHGVGMCQIGALDLAQRGWNYKQILAYYYPKHKLKKIY